MTLRHIVRLDCDSKGCEESLLVDGNDQMPVIRQALVKGWLVEEGWDICPKCLQERVAQQWEANAS
jgi:hypothetical protein